jgi:hypothetical protein
VAEPARQSIINAKQKQSKQIILKKRSAMNDLEGIIRFEKEMRVRHLIRLHEGNYNPEWADELAKELRHPRG